MGRIIGSTLIFVSFAISSGLAQEVNGNPFDPAGGAAVEKQEWTPMHPDGDSPAERMLVLAHTDALPRFDRAELFAVSSPDQKGDPSSKKLATSNTFPVRPYGSKANIHGHVTLKRDACEELRQAWQSLAFDRLGGAFCHEPVYGMRLYRGDDLLFETTICWRCQNFYLPRYSAEKRRYTYGWYGFASDDNAKSLLALFRKHLPHPKL